MFSRAYVFCVGRVARMSRESRNTLQWHSCDRHNQHGVMLLLCGTHAVGVVCVSPCQLQARVT